VTILIGYNDAVGHPAAGIMYRPLTTPVTWAAGAASESVVMGELDMAETPVYIYIYIYVCVCVCVYVVRYVYISLYIYICHVGRRRGLRVRRHGRARHGRDTGELVICVCMHTYIHL